MGESRSQRGHQTRVGHGRRADVSLTKKIALAVVGVVLGVGQLALGAFLVAGNNGWHSALLFSVIGLVGAVVALYSWSSRRSRFGMILAGAGLALGILGSMGLMLDLSQETSGIVHAWSQVPFALLGWMLLWTVWISVALARVLLFEPPHTRHRLSSRRGDAGS